MQHIDFSISTRKIAPTKLCFATTYGIEFKMNSWWFSVLLLVLCCEIVLGEFAGESRAIPHRNIEALQSLPALEKFTDNEKENMQIRRMTQ